jgi:hypothetical protein
LTEDDTATGAGNVWAFKWEQKRGTIKLAKRILKPLPADLILPITVKVGIVSNT